MKCETRCEYIIPISLGHLNVYFAKKKKNWNCCCYAIGELSKLMWKFQAYEIGNFLNCHLTSLGKVYENYAAFLNSILEEFWFRNTEPKYIFFVQVM